MTTNNDSKYAYGVISAHSIHPDQVDHLLNKTGTNITDVAEEIEVLLHHIGEYKEVPDPPASPELSEDTPVTERVRLMDDYRWSLMEFIEEHNLAEPDFVPLAIEEPITVGTCEGVTYQTCWLGGALHFFILRSPVVQKVNTCSPCFPGAGDLDNIKSLPVEASPELEGDFTVGYVPYADCTAYAVPADWRDIPYVD